MLCFQAVDWQADDVPESECPADLVAQGDDAAPGPYSERHVFAPSVFGRCADGRTVALRAHGFRPYFFVTLEGLDRQLGGLVSAVLEEVCERLPRFMRAELHGVGVCRRRRFFGFDNNTAGACFKVTFDSMRAWRVAACRLRGTALLAGGARRKVALYECQTEPLLKMMHSRELPACGWMAVDLGRDAARSERPWARADVCAEVPHAALVPQPERIDVAPILVSSFDIECYSLSGAFPVAKKDYRVVCNTIKDVLASASRNAVPPALWPALVRATVLLSLGMTVPEPQGPDRVPESSGTSASAPALSAPTFPMFRRPAALGFRAGAAGGPRGGGREQSEAGASARDPAADRLREVSEAVRSAPPNSATA
jgi:hypothetical protein